MEKELREILKKQGYDDHTLDVVDELRENEQVKRFEASNGPDSDTNPRVVLKDILEDILFDMKTDEQVMNLLSFLFHIAKDQMFADILIELKKENL